MYKNVLTAMIIRCNIYFVFFIFMVYMSHKNIFTTKISRSTVQYLRVNLGMTGILVVNHSVIRGKKLSWS